MVAGEPERWNRRQHGPADPDRRQCRRHHPVLLRPRRGHHLPCQEQRGRELGAHLDHERVAMEPESDGLTVGLARRESKSGRAVGGHEPEHLEASWRQHRGGGGPDHSGGHEHEQQHEPIPRGCGGLAFTTKSATLYAVSLNGQTQSSTQLRSLPNGGITDNWALAADPGNSFGSYISWPGPARMTALVP